VALMQRFRAFRNYAGPQVPLPLIAASTAAWNDEAHVAVNRALYAERFAAAERILGHLPGFFLPKGGFFLWLKVGNGEAATVKLWREVGVKVLPGAYMGRAMLAAEERTNPGFAYIRVALVSDLSTINGALDRMASVLNSGVSEP
jgi:aspartate/methionine/tyrosine aminotransferase